MGRASALLATPQGVAFCALAVVLGVYYAFAESLPNFTLWWEVAILSLLVIPAVFGLVYLALPLWSAGNLLPAGLAVGVLAAALEILDVDVLANFAKLAAVTLLAFWFLSYFETAAWVTLVAVVIPWVDAYSVWRGPTKHIITHRRELFTTFSFAFRVPGEQNTAQLGLPDLLFFALFLGATYRWNLRTKLTWAAMTLSFGATLALSVGFDLSGLPALPLLAFGFLLPNADLLWKKLRAKNAWGSLRTSKEKARG
ncbi:MAG: hypothetical protein AABM30_06230 [Actinomycetota bacterium]